MELERIKRKTRGLPHMSYEDAQEMKDFILQNKLYDILELGFCHGVSTCYFAGMLDQWCKGHITTIDLESARNNKPNVDTLLHELGLGKYVTVYYEPTSYVWRLMLMLEEHPISQFDLCYIDGAHDWFTDGFAFYLVDKFLRPGGYIVFDDLEWSYATSPTLKHTSLVTNMPYDQRVTQQVKKVYELLVKPHPSYDNFIVKNGRAYAKKRLEISAISAPPINKEIIYITKHVGLGALINKIIRKIFKL